MTLKRIVVCLRCGQRVPPPGSAEKLPLPEFRTDHGPECVCGACVFRRVKLREAETNAATWGAK